MTRTAVIHQPDFLPHLAFFHRFLHADLFVSLDTAQFVRGTSRSWMNRDRIKTPSGPKWLTVAVQDCPRSTPIRDVLLSNGNDWRERNLRQLTESYRRAPFFGEIFPALEGLYGLDCERLVDFNLASIRLLMTWFGIDIELAMSSDLNVSGQNNELLADILDKVGCKKYLSGSGARSYYVSEPFERRGIEVVWQDFRHPVYPQLFGPFEPYMSGIDLLFNCGIDMARQVLRNS